MKQAPFPISPELTAIAIAYRNPASALIADEVMPRQRTPVATKEFKYNVFNLPEAFTVPDTRVGRKGSPNEVGWSAEELTSSVEDFGLDDPIPQDDIDQGRAQGLNVQGESVEFIMNLLHLDREVRVAAVAQNAANYAASNIQALSGTDKFSDAASDPVKILLDALDTPIVRPNIMNLGQSVWTTLRTHPKVIKAIYPNGDGSGTINRKQLADILELEAIHVGTSFVNNARRGQDPTFVRTWGAHVSLHYRDKMATSKRGITWGLTVPYGKPVAGSQPDSKIGLRGGQRVRAGESVRELVTAPQAGFLIQNAI
ncbi:hypothetical protein [Desulfocurvus vexinensis]|uniref:hypothetical protein n=1 Tax=Desulfocurvus vexinensis TaxID=399548 RepID=UPI000491514A|nr:hypothetical protein [Desulfocurvus vexinensis]